MMCMKHAEVAWTNGMRVLNLCGTLLLSFGFHYATYEKTVVLEENGTQCEC